MRSQRTNRLELPSVAITFRGEVSLRSETIWREDRLLSRLGDEEATYLVLDFGITELLTPGYSENDQAPEAWTPSGALSVEIQRVDPTTGEGLAEPTMKQIAADGGAPIAWTGWVLLPVSPRRAEPDDAPIEPDTELDEPGVCAICGAPATYTDAAGSKRCTAHVGESPEAVDEDGNPSGFIQYENVPMDDEP